MFRHAMPETEMRPKRFGHLPTRPRRCAALIILGVSCVFLLGPSSVASAIQPQIPTLQVCNATKIEARAKVHLGSREDSTRPGTFGVQVEVNCDPQVGYPQGKVAIVDLHMTDSSVHGIVMSTTIDQVTSSGGRSPMAFLSGRCRIRHVGPIPDVPPNGLRQTPSLDAQITDPIELPVDPVVPGPVPDPNPFSGCRFWMALADNQEGDNAFGSPDQTADVVGFVVLNGRGQRIAHGMGPLASGDIQIAPSRN
ncbi:MAG: hypothetical protein D6690_08700 [Nitrospirae bacterium]|nr:MAG: hypothetical protein D6690_08700 [Nitrospirota bacterium]